MRIKAELIGGRKMNHQKLSYCHPSSGCWVPAPPLGHTYLCAGGCVLWGSLRWKSSSCSTGTWRPWFRCGFWCELSACSSQRMPGNTADTWRASRGCEYGYGAQGHWASGILWCSRGTHATAPHSPHELSLEWHGKQNHPAQPRNCHKYKVPQHYPVHLGRAVCAPLQ